MRIINDKNYLIHSQVMKLSNKNKVTSVKFNKKKNGGREETSFNFLNVMAD